MELNYKNILESAKASGLSTDKVMWSSIDNLSEMLDVLKAEHSNLYWKFIRKQYGIIHGNHYGPEFADYDVSQLEYTDVNGKKHSGPHWTKEEVEAAMSGKSYPQGTTSCDRYVAANAAYADFNKHFDESQILDIAYDFFFADEDWETNTKVWDYFCFKNK